jgi:hypothetical protein
MLSVQTIWQWLSPGRLWGVHRRTPFAVVEDRRTAQCRPAHGLREHGRISHIGPAFEQVGAETGGT